MNISTSRKLSIVAALLASVAVASGQVSRELGKSSETLKSAFASVVADAAKSTVVVKCSSSTKARGTIIDARGYIVTKASELSDDAISVKLPDGREFPATLVDTRKDLDIACLKIDATGLRAVTLAAPTVEVGEWVATPDSADGVLAVGIVSTPRRAIAPKQGLLGVQMAEPTLAPEGGEAPKGVKIQMVIPNSAAEQAGMKSGDIILKINGKAPADRSELSEMIHSYEPNVGVILTIIRDGKERELKATLKETYADPTTWQGLLELQQEKQLNGDRSVRATNFPAVIQHDTVLTRIQCGGPLVDLAGKVVGINIARAGRTESYAIPADLIIPILKKINAAAATQPATQPSRIISAPKPAG